MSPLPAHLIDYFSPLLLFTPLILCYPPGPVPLPASIPLVTARSFQGYNLLLDYKVKRGLIAPIECMVTVAEVPLFCLTSCSFGIREQHANHNSFDCSCSVVGRIALPEPQEATSSSAPGGLAVHLEEASFTSREVIAREQFVFSF